MNGHYKINLGKKKNLEIRPQFIYRTDFSFSSFDLNLLATYKDKYWAGFTYRNRDSFAFMMGWDIKKKFRVGYSVDIFPASLTNGSIRSHEFNLGFFLK